MDVFIIHRFSEMHWSMDILSSTNTGPKTLNKDNLVACHALANHALVYFFPDFLIPCCPAFRGPFFPATLAISSRAFLSSQKSVLTSVSFCFPVCDAPACCLALNALSSSSSSFCCFFGFLLWSGVVPSVSLCQLPYGGLSMED